MEAFLPIAILLVVGMATCAAIYGLSTLLGPKNPNASKLSVYECGVKPEGNARAPFKSRFYLIAVLFLLFDVEAAFFFPWALIYRDSLHQGGALLLAMIVYLAFMVLGLIYIFQKKALELN
jgi:NADH-quinone oxidoreductase subunit A